MKFERKPKDERVSQFIFHTDNYPFFLTCDFTGSKENTGQLILGQKAS